MAQLDRWRKLVVRFASEHPDEVYLNGQEIILRLRAKGYWLEGLAEMQGVEP